MTAVRPLGVGLLGLGTVGTGVARVLLAKNGALERRIGRPVEIRHVLVRDPHKGRAVILPTPLTTSPRPILEDPEVGVIVLTPE